MDTINERRSIRKYQDRPVEKQLIADIIDAGRAAPSAKNRQPWKYIVFEPQLVNTGIGCFRARKEGGEYHHH